MRSLLFCLLMICSVDLFSQETAREIFVMREEELTDLAAEQLEGKQILLEQFQKRPLDLNRCTAAEMAELGLLTPLQIDSWIRFREKIGAATDWYVFQSVPGWTEALLTRIKMYCRLGSSGSAANPSFLGSLKHQLLVRITTQDPAELPKGRLGAAVSRQFRYRFHSERGLQAAWLMESDAGETFGRRGPDFVSGFLKWKRKPSGNDWLVGDYTVQLGQGLICWQGMAFGVGSDLSAVKRQGLSIRPYQSVGESRFLRGIAVSRQSASWSGDLFLSGNGQTATLYSMAGGITGFRQVDASGYHRTLAEMNKKNSLYEYTLGGRVGKRMGSGSMHVNFIGRSWSLPRFRPSEFTTADTTWKRSMGNLSLDASLTRGSIHLFGEWAMDDRLNASGVMGLVSVIDRRVDVAAHFRWIGRGFQSVDGQAFQRSSSGKPERGIYVQCRIRPAERHTLDVFGDLHQIPEPTAQLSVPTYGVVRGFRWLYQADKRTSLHLRIQTVVSEGMDRELRMPAIRSIHQTSIRLHGNFAVDEKRSLSLRLEKTVYVEQGGRPQDGFLSYLEWSRSFSTGAGADFRLMWVSTDGWDARIYAYEQDVLYKVGFPAFHGQRIRSYLNLSIPVGPRTRIWAKGFFEKNIENQFVASGMASGRSGLTLQVRHQW